MMESGSVFMTGTKNFSGSGQMERLVRKLSLFSLTISLCKHEMVRPWIFHKFEDRYNYHCFVLHAFKVT